MDAAKSCCTASAHRVRRIHNCKVIGNHKMADGKLKCQLKDGTQGSCFTRAVLYKDGTSTEYHKAVKARFRYNLWKKHGLSDMNETEEETNTRIGVDNAHLVRGRPTMGPADFGYKLFKRLLETYLPEVRKHTQKTCMCHYCMQASYMLTGLSKC